MKEITIGIRINEGGLEFFGTEEVNALIQQGYRVSRIEPDQALLEEVESEDEEEESFALAGCEITVTLDDPA